MRKILISILMGVIPVILLCWPFLLLEPPKADTLYILNAVSNPPASIEMTWHDISCEEQLRISEIKYKTVAAEVHSLKKTIEARRELRPDTLYIINTTDGSNGIKFEGTLTNTVTP